MPVARTSRPWIAAAALAALLASPPDALAGPDSIAAEEPDAGTWSTILPPAMGLGNEFAFDSRRNRTFHFDASGAAQDEVWLRPIDGSPWSRVKITAPTFLPGSARLLYDEPSDRFLAVVVVRNQPLDVWAIDAADPTAWVRFESVNAPRSTFGSAIAYDTRRERWLLFGGGWDHAQRPESNELWSLELVSGTARWSRLDPSGPPASEARSDASAAYDSTSDRMFILGGSYAAPQGGSYSASYDVYEVNLSQGAHWSLVSRDVPLARNAYHFAPVVDEARHRLLVIASPGDTIRALALDGTHTWSLLAPPDRPVPQTQFSAAATTADRASFVAWSGRSIWTVPFADARFDSTREVRGDPSLGSDPSFILGRHPDQGTPLFIARYPRPQSRTRAASVWSLDDRVPARWRPIEVAGTLPPALGDHGSALDTRRSRWVLLQGTPESGEAEVWTLEFRPSPHWSRLECRGVAPVVRIGAGVTYDPLADRLLVVPGMRTTSTPADVAVWSLDFQRDNTWALLETSGHAPVSRGRSLTAFDPRANRLVMYGGYRDRPGGGIGGISGSGRFGSLTDVWTLSLAADARWDSIAVIGDSLTTRSQGALEFDPGRGNFLLAASDVSIFEGGSSPRGFQLFELTPGEGAWQSRRISGPHEPVSFGTERAVYSPERDRLFALSTSPDMTVVFDRAQPSRLVPITVDLKPGNGPSRAASAHGPDVAAAFLTGSDFDPLETAISSATLDGVDGVAVNGGRAQRDADGDGRADRWFAFDRAALGLSAGERTFELRAIGDDGVTLVGFAQAAAAGGAGRGRAGEADASIELAADVLAFAVTIDTPLRTDGGLRLTLPEEREVTIEVFSVNGRRIAGAAPGRMAPGRHQVALPGAARLAPGVYWARVRAGVDLWTGRVVRVE